MGEGFFLWGWTGWGDRGGEGGFLKLGSSAGACGQKLKLGGQLMLEHKSKGVSGPTDVDVFLLLNFPPPLHCGLLVMRKGLEVLISLIGIFQ